MRVIPLLIFFFLSASCFGQKPDTAQCLYYVVQNPEYYSDNARGWFEISGLKDRIIQNRINDTLRKLFDEPTGLHEGAPTPGYIYPATPAEGFTNYVFSFYNDTVQRGIQLKDSDSICYLSPETMFYGAGENLFGCAYHLAKNKMISISITPWEEHPDYYGRHHSLEIAFSLVTGNCMPLDYYVHIDSMKRDSLLDLLYFRGQYMLDDSRQTSEEFRQCRIYRDSIADQVDSVMITAEFLVDWLNRSLAWPYDTWSFSYKLHCPPKVDRSASMAVPIKFDQLTAFFNKDEWSSLQVIYTR